MVLFWVSFIAISLFLGATERWLAFGITVVTFIIAAFFLARRRPLSESDAQAITHKFGIVSLAGAAIAIITLYLSRGFSLGLNTQVLVIYATSLSLFGAGFVTGARKSAKSLT